MKILTYNFKLIREPGFHDNVNGNNNDQSAGWINYKRQEIKVDPEHGEELQTVFHELLHAADRYWYARLEEHQVEKISEGLFHILKQNGVDLTPLLIEE